MSGAPHAGSQQRLTHGVTVDDGVADGDVVADGDAEAVTDGAEPRDTDADGDAALDADTHWQTRGKPLQTTAPKHGVTLGDTLIENVKPDEAEADGDTLPDTLASGDALPATLADTLCVGGDAATDGETDALALLLGLTEYEASQMHV